MTTLLFFAQLGLPDANKVGDLLIRALAVGGVALLGYVGTWIAITLLARSLYGGKVPKVLGQVLQGAGGVTAGVSENDGVVR